MSMAHLSCARNLLPGYDHSRAGVKGRVGGGPGGIREVTLKSARIFAI
jgi:hypothetical protein